MDQTKNSSNIQNPQKIFCKQPITCPWITSQPYPSTLNKNRACESSVKSLPNIPLSMEPRNINEKTCPSLQHSSSQFFYFLRLMQLFPETHPATLHTVLCLCKNDFFCAVDKLLYAKRCKSLYTRSQNMFKRCSASKSHPYCGHSGSVKIVGQPEKLRSNDLEPNSNMGAASGAQKSPEGPRVQIIAENNLDCRMSKEDNGDSNNTASIFPENEPLVHTDTATAHSVFPLVPLSQVQYIQKNVEDLSTTGNTINTNTTKESVSTGVDKTSSV